ncbi:hypothetical protein BJ546DRAFT_244787 [Cryomyces antarcticus]
MCLESVYATVEGARAAQVRISSPPERHAGSRVEKDGWQYRDRGCEGGILAEERREEGCLGKERSMLLSGVSQLQSALNNRRTNSNLGSFLHAATFAALVMLACIVRWKPSSTAPWPRHRSWWTYITLLFCSCSSASSARIANGRLK